MIGCGMISSTILGSQFGSGSSCLHCVRVYGRTFSIDPPVKIKYLLFRSIQIKSPNTGFVLSTGLVKNPFISPLLWNYMLDRYAIENCRISVLIIPMNRNPCFHNTLSAVTDTKYESAQTILSVLSHGITTSFSTFLP